MTGNALSVHARLAAMASIDGGLGLLDDGAVCVRDGRIAFVGSTAAAPSETVAAGERIDCASRRVTPGSIDCHTHLVHGGDRSGEFEMRLRGASYEDIARAGGGIRSTWPWRRTAIQARRR